MSQNIDDIRFGNMSQECMSWCEKSTYLDKHITALTSFTFPLNTSKTTREELNAIAQALYDVKQPANENRLKTYKEFDRKAFSFFKELIDHSESITDKEEYVGLLSSIIADASPLIYKLKEYYQRPRPYQLAKAYKLNLFPYKTVSQDCPSYPSASVYFAKIFTEVIGNRCPQMYGNMQHLFSDIYHSRYSLGFSFHSDLDSAIIAANKVLDDQEFKVKYKL